MKKILYLVTEDWYFRSHRLALAEAALRQGYEVHVVTRTGEYAAEIAETGFNFHPLSMSRSIGSLSGELGTFVELCRYYRNIKPDLIHHIALKPVLMGSVAAWITRVPVVVNSYTGLGFLFISDSLFSRIFRHVMLPVLSLLLKGRRYYSIVQNSDDRALLTKAGLINDERTALIRGSGVDTGTFSCSPECKAEQPVVLFASRLLKDKGILEFIDAVRQLRDKNVQARFVVVGDVDGGNPTSIDPGLIRHWVADGLIEWWGHRADMHNVFSQVHIVCLPSYREGLPKVLLEAAACGRPLVTTDVPGCREVVCDGVNGILVQARDSTGLAEAIHKLIGSPGLRRQMGQAGRKIVMDNFDMERINSETTALYGKLMASSDQKS